VLLAGRPEHKATGVTAKITRMDESLFGEKSPVLRGAYGFLSEFVHPNHFGVLGLYSTHFPEEYRIEFGNIAEKKRDILPNLRVTTGMIWLVEIAAKDIDELMPQIYAFRSEVMASEIHLLRLGYAARCSPRRCRAPAAVLVRFTDNQGRLVRQREVCERHARWVKENMAGVRDLPIYYKA